MLNVRAMAAAILVAGTCFALPQSSFADPIKIGVSKSGWLMWLAEDLGSFRQAGVDVELTVTTSGVAALKGVQEGKYQLAASSEFAFASQAFANTDIHVLCAIGEIRNVRLIARTDRGILQPQDLVGKTIGLRRKSISEFLLGRLLDLNGVDQNTVKVVDISAVDLATSLKDGTVDAIVSWEPYAGQAEAAVPEHHVSMTVQGKQPYYFILSGYHNDLTKRQDDYVKLMSALVKTSEWADQNPKKALQRIAEVLDVPLADVQKLAKEQLMDVSLQQDMLILMELEAAWRMDRGLSQGPFPDFLSLMHMPPLLEADETRVTIIR